MKAQQTAPAKAEKGRQKQEGNGQNMYVIAGLGNPKKEYDNTRHNIGFSVIDMLADKTGISVNTAKHKGLLGAGIFKRAENNSGKAADLYEPERRMYPGSAGLL